MSKIQTNNQRVMQMKAWWDTDVQLFRNPHSLIDPSFDLISIVEGEAN